ADCLKLSTRRTYLLSRFPIPKQGHEATGTRSSPIFSSVGADNGPTRSADLELITPQSTAKEPQRDYASSRWRTRHPWDDLNLLLRPTDCAIRPPASINRDRRIEIVARYLKVESVDCRSRHRIRSSKRLTDITNSARERLFGSCGNKHDRSQI